MWLPGILLVALHLLVTRISAEFEYGSDQSQRPILLFVAAEALAGVIYLVSALKARNALDGRAALVWIVLVGLAMRAAFFFSTPIQEDDYYRYLWDGAVVAAGINPYAHAPDAALGPDDDSGSAPPGLREPAGLREPPKLRELAQRSGVVAARVNHPDLRTIYPPVAQGAFALAHRLGPWSITAWRAVLLVFDAATLCLVVILLRSLRLPLAFMLIYWWNPVLVKETFNSAHMDVVALPFAMGAILLAVRNRRLAGAVSLAFAMGAKLWPITLAPILLRPLLANPKRLVAAICLIGIIGAAFFVPIHAGGLGGDSGFTAYGKRWEMNDALFMAFVWAGKLVMKAAGAEHPNGQLAARVAVSLLLLALIGTLARREATDGLDLCEKCLFVIAALFLLSPTQFPWYFIWMLPLLAIRPRASLLLLTALLPLYYLRFYFAARDNVGFFDSVIVWIEFAPVWCVLAWELYRARRRGLAPETEVSA